MQYAQSWVLLPGWVQGGTGTLCLNRKRLVSQLFKKSSCDNGVSALFTTNIVLVCCCWTGEKTSDPRHIDFSRSPMGFSPG